MFERFTERARQVLVLADDEARALGHGAVGSEHVLLGLLREEEGLAARALESFGIAIEEVRALAVVARESGEPPGAGPLPFAPDATAALERSLREALELGHNYIGTEHLLLGLLAQSSGAGVRILSELAASLDEIRAEVVEMLSAPSRRRSSAPHHEQAAFDLVSSEVAEELGKLRDEKERAIERGDFERAAAVRDRERRLGEAVRALNAVWTTGTEPEPERPVAVVLPSRGVAAERPPFVLAAVLAAAAFAVGVLVAVLV